MSKIGGACGIAMGVERVGGGGAAFAGDGIN